MAISKERRQWIVRVAEGRACAEVAQEGLDGLPDEELDDYYERPYREFFTSVSDPEELHIFADCSDAYHLADRGVGIHLWPRVIRHRLCDLGTALMVYWRLARHIHRRIAAEDARLPAELRLVVARSWEVQLRILGLLREIEQRVARREYRGSSLRFDPHNHGGEDLTANLAWGDEHGEPPPAYMYEPVGQQAGGAE
jgi:hypothetical protein